jgi:hypothetical protein
MPIIRRVLLCISCVGLAHVIRSLTFIYHYFFAVACTITGDYSFATQEKTLEITSWEEVAEVK